MRLGPLVCVMSLPLSACRQTGLARLLPGAVVRRTKLCVLPLPAADGAQEFIEPFAVLRAAMLAYPVRTAVNLVAPLVLAVEPRGFLANAAFRVPFVSTLRE